jgi:hypothetical protein
MVQKLKEFGGLGAAILLLLSFFIPGSPKPFGNATASFQDAALGFRVNGTEVISSAAVVDGVVSTTAVTGTALTGTSFTLNGVAQPVTRCVTSSWNPGTVSSTTLTTIDITDASYVQGDNFLTPSLATNTTGMFLASIATSSATGTFTVELMAASNTQVAYDLTTTTVKACYIH